MQECNQRIAGSSIRRCKLQNVHLDLILSSFPVPSYFPSYFRPLRFRIEIIPRIPRKPQAKYRSRSPESTVNIRLIRRSVIERGKTEGRNTELSKLSQYTSAGFSPCFAAIDSAGANSGIRMQS